MTPLHADGSSRVNTSQKTEGANPDLTSIAHHNETSEINDTEKPNTRSSYQLQEEQKVGGETVISENNPNSYYLNEDAGSPSHSNK